MPYDHRWPASVRYNNPGAQYPGPSARKFGSTGTQVIGGGHKIAVFDDPVNGAAAQFDLLGRNYVGMPLGQLINKWSGGNSSSAYAKYVSGKTGVPIDAPVTAEMLRDPNFAVSFAKAKAEWETGKPYPMTDDQWRSAHKMAFGDGGGAPAAPRDNPPAAQPQAPSYSVAGAGGRTPAPASPSPAPSVAAATQPPGGMPSPASGGGAGSSPSFSSVLASLTTPSASGGSSPLGALGSTLGGLAGSGGDSGGGGNPSGDLLKSSMEQAEKTNAEYDRQHAEIVKRILARRKEAASGMVG